MTEPTELAHTVTVIGFVTLLTDLIPVIPFSSFNLASTSALFSLRPVIARQKLQLHMTTNRMTSLFA